MSARPRGWSVPTVVLGGDLHASPNGSGDSACSGVAGGCRVCMDARAAAARADGARERAMREGLAA